MRATVCALAALLPVLVASAAVSPVREGWRRYQGVCGHCHGPDGAGSSFAPSLVDPLPSRDRFDAAVLQGVSGARGVMRGFAGDPPLGVLEGVAYAGRRLPLAGGDTLFLYTDGVTEAFAPDGRAYGEDRLRRRLQGLCGLAPRQVTEQVVADVASFARGAEPSDDLTCLAVTVGM